MTSCLPNSGAGVGDVDVTVKGPDGRVVPVKVEPIQQAAVNVKYTPTHPGDHEVKVSFANHDIPKSPYYVHVEYRE